MGHSSVRAGWTLAFALTVLDSAAAATPDEQYAGATALYAEGHYAAAYRRLVALADDDHADAARMALLMVRFGPELYANEWQPSGPQVERWLNAATRLSACHESDGDD